MDEQTIQATEAKLDIMWDKLQELKETDPLAAQFLYEKYKAIALELPPPVPSGSEQLMLPM